MAELHDIEAHLLENPGDHAQRWRLAKKLYMAREYRDALAHLLILKRNTEWKLNHSRYLAATYYRLGRYDEAIKQLLEAIATWPDEIPLREQLARVYEVAGNTGDAVRVWQEILELDPRHPIAAPSVQRLTAAPAELTPEQELHLNDSDSGIDLVAGMACPKCGARNSLDFERCWQCHALIAGPGTPTPDIRKPKGASTSVRAWTVLIGFVTVALVTGGVYITLRFAASRPATEDGFIVATSVDSLLNHEWFLARMAAGGALFAAWPAILWLAAITCCDRPVGFRYIAGASLPAAALTYVLLWLPFRMMPFAIAAPILMTLIAVPLLFPVGPFRALIAWTVHIVLVFLCGFGVFVAVADVSTLNHLGDLLSLDAARREELPEGVYTMSATQLPAEWSVTWADTGSVWLNSAGRLVHFEITADEPNALLRADFLEMGYLQYSEEQPAPIEFTYAIVPQRNYTLRLRGRGAGAGHVSISGLLLPEVTAK